MADREVAQYLDDPLVLRAAAIDPDDAPYIAAVLAVGADCLWTRGKALLVAFPSLAVRMMPSPPLLVRGPYPIEDFRSNVD